jgi:hypothetical protein
MITMQVDSIYIPEVTIEANPGTVINSDQTVTFTTVVSKAGANPRYQWLVNNAAIAGATESVYTRGGFADGDSVTCVVYGSGECGYATINSVVMKVTEVNNVKEVVKGMNLQLVPNPNSGKFVISGNVSVTDGAVSISVTDMLGKVIYTGTGAVKGGMLREDVTLTNTVANGMYLLTVRSNEQAETLHFVVRQ